MKKTKIIRGKPVYWYKGTQHLDIDENMFVSKMLYDEETNTTNCYLKKYGIKLEFVTSLIIIACIAFNLMYEWGNNLINVNYSSIATYYDNNLYINLQNNSSTFDITYQLLDDDSIIHEGCCAKDYYVITIPIDDVKDNYKLRVIVDIMNMQVIQDANVIVLNKSIEEI